tara:strand:+ start:4736 stop:6199 length:1464 start_codon:yes stop_codon:yes gene_type:complete
MAINKESILNDKDLQILQTNISIDYSTKDNKYLGGVFGSNENDVVEVLIYDINDNLLETSIVHPDDVEYDVNVGVKLNTGTILRKLNYDKGKFVVKYNFLRTIAGSHETVLVDRNDDIFTGDFNPTNPDDVGRIGTDLFIKENKYLIHEISPSRKEVRIIPARIKQEKYLRDFFNLAKKYKTVTNDGSDQSKLQLKSADGVNVLDSPRIGFVNIDSSNPPVFTDDMIGGTLTLPRVFIRRYEYLAPPPGSGNSVQGNEVITTDITTTMQARFFVTNDTITQAVDNSGGYIGDQFQDKAFEIFKGISGQGFGDEDFPGEDNNTTGIGFYRYKDTRKMKNIYDTDDRDFGVISFASPNDSGQQIIVQSNSLLPADVTTHYRWELTGYDIDGDLKANNATKIRPGGLGNDVGIQSESDDDNFVYASDGVGGNGLIGECTVDAADNPRKSARLLFRIYSSKCRVGIKLTVTNSINYKKSLIHIPCFIETRG